MIAFRIAAAAMLLAAAPAASPAAPTVQLARAAQAPAATVDAFHAALRRGDTAAAAGLLADDALIFEAGGAEHGKAEYLAAHLAADAEFARAVESVTLRRSGGADGRLAWVASEGRATGSFRGRAVDSATTETMLLRRVGRDWKITHIHWSSAKNPR